MEKIELSEWKVEDFLTDFNEQLGFLNAALEEEDSKAAYIQDVLGSIARVQGMTKVAHDVDVGRESLYKSLSMRGNPSFKTIFNVFHALGFDLRAIPMDSAKTKSDDSKELLKGVGNLHKR